MWTYNLVPIDFALVNAACFLAKVLAHDRLHVVAHQEGFLERANT